MSRPSNLTTVPQSYCLKVKEMDDEEYTYQALQEPLYRIETGNYEYRLILRCRQEARKRFATLRSDVLVKLELLDQKHVQNMTVQLVQFIGAVSTFTNSCHKLLGENLHFPIELDLSQSCLIQNLTSNEEASREAAADDTDATVYRDEAAGSQQQLAESAIDLAEEVKSLLANAFDDDHDNTGGGVGGADNDRLDVDRLDNNNHSDGDSPANANSNLDSLIDIFGNKDTTVADSSHSNLLLD